jgi:hypothetical protein
VAHGRLAELLRPLVAVAVEHAQEQGDDNAGCSRGNQRDLGRVVVGRVFGSEGLGADDVGD